jgi:phosphoribosylanthranilate isomerase
LPQQALSLERAFHEFRRINPCRFLRRIGACSCGCRRAHPGQNLRPYPNGGRPGGVPRGIGLEQAAVVRGGLPPFVTAVGVFVNADSEFVTRAIREVSLDVIQFHGDEDAGYCASFGKPYIKAVQVREGLDLHRFARRYSSARALLLDSFEPQRRGGTGNIFDWSLIPVDLGKPYILAGGLGPDNVAAAIAKASPYAVDGNGGVESSPGVKDPEKIEAFIREVNRGTTS